METKRPNRSFTLSDKEQYEANEWIKEHKKICPYSFENENLPTLGEHFYFKFIPNGLGYVCSVGCCYCDVEKDITDTSLW